MTKNSRRFSRGQAGLEYLITYGWVLVVIATIVSTLVLLMGSQEGTASCSNFENFLIKGAKADTEKVQLVVQNATGGSVDGLKVYGGIVYGTANSPPLFQININDATVGNAVNSAGLSNDYVIDYMEGYKNPLGNGAEKTVIIPWPVRGFGFSGSEFGEDGCLFFTESLGKKFNTTITVYYRDKFGVVRQETTQCTGTIQSTSEIDFPPSTWGC